MFAIIQTGGKQYKVASGDLLQVEKLDGDAGASVTLAEVLLLSDGKQTTIGTPTITGASVSAEIVSQDRTGKIIIFKKRRRQNSRRRKQHQQPFTVLRITGIKG